jgi:flagellar biosynthesis/type III secretory pathway protein FliH
MSSFEPWDSRAPRAEFQGGAPPWIARERDARAGGEPPDLRSAPAANSGAAAGAAGGEALVEPAPAGPDPAAFERATRALEALAEALRHPAPNYLAIHRHCAVELAIAIARAVLAREVRSNPDALAAAVERALSGLAPERPLRLRLASSDFAALSHGLAPQLEAVRASVDLAVVEDSSLAPGEFALDGNGIDLEARWPELLERVSEALAGELGAEAP